MMGEGIGFDLSRLGAGSERPGRVPSGKHMEHTSNERRAGSARMAGWACAFMAALVAPHTGADPVITPDPGRNPSAVSPLAPATVSDKRHELKLDYSTAPVGLRIVLPPPDASEKRPAAARGGKRRAVVGFPPRHAG